MDADNREPLIALFEQTGHAHHEAFIEVDGDDPDWPNWYTNYIIDKLPDVIGVKLDTDTVKQLILNDHEEYEHTTPEDPWPAFYADYFMHHM